MRDSATHHRHLLAAEVVGWRRERLVPAALPPAWPEHLRVDRRIGLHALIKLTERGCPSETAARILAPGPRCR